MSHFLGIDLGGTKTHAIIATESGDDVKALQAIDSEARAQARAFIETI